MKNKILLFLGIFAVIFVGFVTTVNAASNSTIVDKEYEAYLERNWAQVELATKVHTYITDHYGIKEVFKDEYPSYFGGMYISDDASNLVIQIVKNNIPNEDSKEYSIYKEIINMDSSIKIEYVENSFNELNAVNNNVVDYLSNTTAKYQNISSSSIDVMNNIVVIELVDNSIVQQEDFKKIVLNSSESIDSKLIKFGQAKYTTYTNINAGGQITAANGGICSMGLRVKYNNKNGYLTAGHCVNGVGTTIPSGTVRVKQLANNQNYDYAFVETNSSYTPTNNLAYTTTGITYLGLINYCPFITVNMAVAKAGRTTGYTSGTVTGLNASVTYSDLGITIKGMIKTNVYAQPGDSGGAVIIPRTDANGGAIGLGILSGGNSTTMYFSDINVLPIALQNRY